MFVDHLRHRTLDYEFTESDMFGEGKRYELKCKKCEAVLFDKVVCSFVPMWVIKDEVSGAMRDHADSSPQCVVWKLDPERWPHMDIMVSDMVKKIKEEVKNA